jgi:hypothetical protein
MTDKARKLVEKFLGEDAGGELQSLASRLKSAGYDATFEKGQYSEPSNVFVPLGGSSGSYLSIYTAEDAPMEFLVQVNDETAGELWSHPDMQLRADEAYTVALDFLKAQSGDKIVIPANFIRL